jgi:Spy/CpxP family protein refolding chaperone
MNPTWKVILGVLLVFLIGCAAGAFATSLVFHHRILTSLHGGPAAMAQIIERRATRNLDLTSEQRDQVHHLIVENLTQRQQLQKQIQPQMRELNQQTLAQIQAVLNPDQAQKFHDNLELIRLETGHNFFPVPKATTTAPPATNSSSVGAAPAP